MENLCGLSENKYTANQIKRRNQMAETQKGSNKVKSQTGKVGGISESVNKNQPSQGEFVKPSGKPSK